MVQLALRTVFPCRAVRGKRKWSWGQSPLTPTLLSRTPPPFPSPSLCSPPSAPWRASGSSLPTLGLPAMPHLSSAAAAGSAHRLSPSRILSLAWRNKTWAYGGSLGRRPSHSPRGCEGGGGLEALTVRCAAGQVVGGLPVLTRCRHKGLRAERPQLVPQHYQSEQSPQSARAPRRGEGWISSTARLRVSDMCKAHISMRCRSCAHMDPPVAEGKIKTG